MVTLKLHKRLAASILKCGKNRIWIDPTEVKNIKNGSTRSVIKTQIKNGFIQKKNVTVHSRFRANKRLEEKRKGRHTGIGKRRGTKNARMPEKILWIRK